MTDGQSRAEPVGSVRVNDVKAEISYCIMCRPQVMTTDPHKVEDKTAFGISRGVAGSVADLGQN